MTLNGFTFLLNSMRLFGTFQNVFHYRLFDRYDRLVASFAILGDESPTWRPERYGYVLWGCEAGLKFPTVKLLDYKKPEEWARLEQSRNPFAVLVMAHLHTQATRRKSEERYALKWQLTRRLYEQGYSKKDIRLLFRFIDWLMILPPALTYKFEKTLVAYEEAHKMPYITSIEQIGIEKGLKQGLEQGLEQGFEKGLKQGVEKGLKQGVEQGLKQGVEQGLKQGVEQGTARTLRQSILQVLQVRFGEIPEAVVEAIERLEERSRLEKLHEQAILVASVADFEQVLTADRDL